MAELISRNQMTATELKAKYGKIDFVESPKTGKLFFSCGSIVGYISPAVQQAAEAGTLKLEDMQYAECKDSSKPDTDESGRSNWISCLMKKASNNVKFSF